MRRCTASIWFWSDAVNGMVIELNKIVGVTTASNKRKRSLTEMCLCVNTSRFNNYWHGHITSYHHICIVIGFLKPFPNPDCRFQSWLLFEGRIKIEISNDAHAAYAPEVPTRANPHAAFALHKACMPHHSWNTWESPSQSFVLQHMATQPNPHVFLFFYFFTHENSKRRVVLIFCLTLNATISA